MEKGHRCSSAIFLPLQITSKNFRKKIHSLKNSGNFFFNAKKCLLEKSLLTLKNKAMR